MVNSDEVLKGMSVCITRSEDVNRGRYRSIRCPGNYNEQTGRDQLTCCFTDLSRENNFISHHRF